MATFPIHIQETPNPDALKFISQYTVRAEGRSNYHQPEEAAHNPLAMAIFGIDGVKALYFYDNYITVTKEDRAEWTDIVDEVMDVLMDRLPGHDPGYRDVHELAEERRKAELSPELREIDEVLERTIRPYLQADGGGIDVISKEGNLVTVKYNGACGTCPSSMTGTLQAIQNILRDEIDPELVVQEESGGLEPGRGPLGWW